ncbi:MAG: sporulation integral membrane protein YtvI [bacterium]|nr:sporulation integral membrane protein YtvI [bacterium]
MEERLKFIRIFLNIGIPLLWIGLVVLLGPKLLNFFMPFVIGWVIAMIANPLVRFMEKRLKMVRRHSSVVVVVAALALVVLGMYLIGAKIAIEVSSFVKDLPKLYELVADEVSGAMNNLERIFYFLPQRLQDSFNIFSENLGSAISEAVKEIAAPTVEVAGNVAKKIPNALIYSIITILSAYFFIAERDKIMAGYRNYAPKSVQKYLAYLKGDIRKVVGGYFMAQFKIMFVVAVILAVGFALLRVEYAPLFAILIAILDFLPFFGTGTALIPWAAVKMFSGEYRFAVGLLILYAVSQIVRQVIQPKIVGDSFGLHPLVTLFFLYLGFRMRGIAGMILAVPVGLLAINFYQYGAFDSLFENVKLLAEEIQKIRWGDREKTEQKKDKEEKAER